MKAPNIQKHPYYGLESPLEVKNTAIIVRQAPMQVNIKNNLAIFVFFKGGWWRLVVEMGGGGWWWWR